MPAQVPLAGPTVIPQRRTGPTTMTPPRRRARPAVRPGPAPLVGASSPARSPTAWPWPRSSSSPPWSASLMQAFPELGVDHRRIVAAARDGQPVPRARGRCRGSWSTTWSCSRWRCPRSRASPSRAVFTVAVIFLLALHHHADRRSAGPGSASPAAWGSRCWPTSATGSRARACCPTCPTPWHAESVIRSAGGTPFAGDFFVVGDIETGPPRRRRWSTSPARATGPAPARCCSPGRWAAWSPRVEPAEFLPAANAYLLNHPWQDGFATAVHLSLDLATGAFRIWTAGHPPALHWRAGAGRWTPAGVRGPDARPDPGRRLPRAPAGSCARGDALMLYTDGMVETRTRRHRDRHRPADRPGRPPAAQQLRRAARPAGRLGRAAAATTARCSWSGATERRRDGSRSGGGAESRRVAP